MKEYTDYDESDAEICVSTFHCVMVGIFVVALLALFTGCKTVEYVQVPEYHTDTLIVNKVQRDSIHIRDSMYVEVKGDTVRIDRWHTKFIEKLLHDTCYQSKTDTVPVPYPVEKKVEKQLSWWQQTQMYAGDVLLLLLMGGAVYGIIKLRHK